MFRLGSTGPFYGNLKIEDDAGDGKLPVSNDNGELFLKPTNEVYGSWQTATLAGGSYMIMDSSTHQLERYTSSVKMVQVGEDFRHYTGGVEDARFGAKLLISEINAFGSGGLRIEDDGNNLAIFVEDGGQVGIANATPSAALDVTGNIAVSGTVDGVDLASHASDVTTKHLPSQSGQSGNFLTTNGTVASWDSVSGSLPDQSGHNGQYLKTNGSAADWAVLDISGYTPSRAMMSNIAGQLTASDITDTELGRLDGVSDNIQSQFTNHVGVGGTSQHPAASGTGSSTITGFMTPAMVDDLDANSAHRGTTTGNPHSLDFDDIADSGTISNSRLPSAISVTSLEASGDIDGDNIEADTAFKCDGNTGVTDDYSVGVYTMHVKGGIITGMEI